WDAGSIPAASTSSTCQNQLVACGRSSDAEALATSACRGCRWVLDPEARLIELVAVIDARAGYVFRAGSVDEDADAELVRFMIELAGPLVELQLVAKATAPACSNHEAERVPLRALARP